MEKSNFYLIILIESFIIKRQPHKMLKHTKTIRRIKGFSFDWYFNWHGHFQQSKELLN